MEVRATRGTLVDLEDNKEEPAYNDWDSRDEEALAKGENSEIEKKTITRSHGVGCANKGDDGIPWGSHCNQKHQLRSFYGPLNRKAYNALAMTAQVLSAMVADLTSLAPLAISEEEEGRSQFNGAPTTSFFLSQHDDTILQGSNRFEEATGTIKSVWNR